MVLHKKKKIKLSTNKRNEDFVQNNLRVKIKLRKPTTRFGRDEEQPKGGNYGL